MSSFFYGTKCVTFITMNNVTPQQIGMRLNKLTYLRLI